MSEKPISDLDRYPTLTDAGRRMLEFLREHPRAPFFRNRSGNRLKAEDVAAVRRAEREVHDKQVGWRVGGQPAWLEGFVARCFELVPFYRKLGAPPRRFADAPTISRADLSRNIAAFVPDDQPLDRLINFRTSGTTGHALLLPSHPVVAACYLAFHKRALRRFGIELRYGRGRVGVVLVGFQRECFTYVSVTPTMDESGLAKINLHPGDWREPEDRACYLDALAPEVYTGDPISFAELARLPLRTRPRALLSTSMALLPGLQKMLEDRFECPVLDIYSLNEAGPIAVRDSSAGGHVLLQHRLYVEILDPRGHPVAPGERGEVTLSGGFNPYLPLLRYRTGDYASLFFAGELPILSGLEGRPPVRFMTTSGEWLNNIEVTFALRCFAISQYAAHQAEDGSVLVRVVGAELPLEEIRRVLTDLLGQGSRVRVTSVPPLEGKVVQYTSAIPESLE